MALSESVSSHLNSQVHLPPWELIGILAVFRMPLGVDLQEGASAFQLPCGRAVFSPGSTERDDRERRAPALVDPRSQRNSTRSYLLYADGWDNVWSQWTVSDYAESEES